MQAATSRESSRKSSRRTSVVDFASDLLSGELNAANYWQSPEGEKKMQQYNKGTIDRIHQRVADGALAILLNLIRADPDHEMPRTALAEEAVRFLLQLDPVSRLTGEPFDFELIRKDVLGKGFKATSRKWARHRVIDEKLLKEVQQDLDKIQPRSFFSGGAAAPEPGPGPEAEAEAEAEAEVDADADEVTAATKIQAMQRGRATRKPMPWVFSAKGPTCNGVSGAGGDGGAVQIGSAEPDSRPAEGESGGSLPAQTVPAAGEQEEGTRPSTASTGGSRPPSAVTAGFAPGLSMPSLTGRTLSPS